MSEAALEYTEDAFLGGQLMLRQPKAGHRAGHDALLLAASCRARPDERVVEFGAGVGAASLALARRVGGLDLTLVEIDPALAALARDNAEANGIPYIGIEMRQDLVGDAAGQAVFAARLTRLCQTLTLNIAQERCRGARNPVIS